MLALLASFLIVPAWGGVSSVRLEVPADGIIALGGTIAMRESGGLRGGALDSSQILLTDLSEIARTVRGVLDRGQVPVLTHGTDSLDTTGLVLSQLFPDRFMVLTAAFRPESSPGSDSPGNRAAALLLRRETARPDVPKVPYAAMNGKVFLAASLAKLDVDFMDGRRGFGSYAGPVGRIEGDAVVWEEGFLGSRRPSGLALSPDLGLAPAEIAYINRFTPRAYIRAVLGRLESGQSEATVFHGVFPSSPNLIKRILALRAQGHPVYVQRFSGAGPEAALFPPGLQPFQLLYKLSSFLGRAASLPELEAVLRRDVAGEVAPASDPSLSLDVVEGNFYRSRGARRGFLLYHQNLELMRSALRGEIARLRGEPSELILEGIGNGHVHLGLLDLLADAARQGVSVLVTTRVKDAVPDGAYEVGRALSEAGARPSTLPGRDYLRSVLKL